MFTRKHKSYQEAEAAVYAGVATPEEKKLYRTHKAREARESQAAWAANHPTTSSVRKD